jgi:hypothetical protein
MARTVIDLNNGVKLEPRTPGTAGNDLKARVDHDPADVTPTDHRATDDVSRTNRLQRDYHCLTPNNHAQGRREQGGDAHMWHGATCHIPFDRKQQPRK